MSLSFQLLALDPAEKTRCKSAESLLYLVRGFSDLWKKPKVEDPSLIVDGTTSVRVRDVEDAGDGASPSAMDIGHAFTVELIGNYEDVADLREPLAAFIKDLGFELVYVLRDEVSEQIACRLYPHLYRIENLLRGYLIRFMATHVGPQWWELTVSNEMANKAKSRKKNEPVFGKHVENSAYLVDFGELGEIVYEHSSGFRTMEDIISRIGAVEETPEAIRALKEELKSNYHKLFKESFADKAFKEKWKQFERLRNKIAHGNLFITDDLTNGERLATEICQIIEASDVEASKISFTEEEREAIKEQVVLRSALSQEITAEQLVAELELQEQLYRGRPEGFVGFSKFVNNHLSSKGFSPAKSRESIEYLRAVGVVEIYHVPNPKQTDRPVAAIRKAAAKALLAT